MILQALVVSTLSKAGASGFTVLSRFLTLEKAFVGQLDHLVAHVHSKHVFDIASGLGSNQSSGFKRILPNLKQISTVQISADNLVSFLKSL